MINFNNQKKINFGYFLINFNNFGHFLINFGHFLAGFVGSGSGGSQVVPALGDSWAHQPNWRIVLESANLQEVDHKSEQFEPFEHKLVQNNVGVRATILKCPSKAAETTHFLITSGGIRDPS